MKRTRTTMLLAAGLVLAMSSGCAEGQVANPSTNLASSTSDSVASSNLPLPSSSPVDASTVVGTAITASQASAIAAETFGAPAGATTKQALMTFSAYEQEYGAGETTQAVDGATQIWLVTVLGIPSKFLNAGPPGNTLAAADSYSVLIDAANGRVMEFINGAKLK